MEKTKLYEEIKQGINNYMCRYVAPYEGEFEDSDCVLVALSDGCDAEVEIEINGYANVIPASRENESEVEVGMDVEVKEIVVWNEEDEEVLREKPRNIIIKY